MSRRDDVTAENDREAICGPYVARRIWRVSAAYPEKRTGMVELAWEGSAGQCRRRRHPQDRCLG